LNQFAAWDYIIAPDFATFQRRALNQFVAWGFIIANQGIIHLFHTNPRINYCS